jgi:hypothetical protein
MQGPFFGGPFFGGGFFGSIPGGGGGSRRGRKDRKPKLQRRPLTEFEFAELQDRLHRIAAQQAVASIPMNRIADEGEVIGDSSIEDDDLILKAMLVRILH